MEQPQPTSIGKYEIISEIGRGDMGVVYRAQDSRSSAQVAVRIFHEGYFRSYKDATLRRLYHSILDDFVRLRHPNIASVLEWGEVDGVPFVVTEFVAGDSLLKLIENANAVALTKKLEIIKQICRALSYAHHEGVLHQNLKPSNIVVNEDGTARLLDFGFPPPLRCAPAKLIGAEQISEAHFYIAPEIRGNRLCSVKSDVFAMGVLLFQLLTSETHWRSSKNTPRPLSDFFSGYPPALDEIIRNALATEPGKRYKDAAALHAAIAAAQKTYEGTDAFETLLLDLSAPRQELMPWLRIPRPPESMGKYSVQSEIGRWAMGSAYRVEDPTTRKEMAVKIFGDWAVPYYRNPIFNRLYRSVLNRMLRLRHENIVTVHDWGEKDGLPYITTDPLQGETLDEVMKAQRPLSLQIKLQIIRQVCCGLEYAHQRGIFHYNLAPTSITLLRDGEIRIADFGFPKLLGIDGGDPNYWWEAMWTDLVAIVYNRPSEAWGGLPWDARSDVFDAGVLLFQLLSGRLPIVGAGEWNGNPGVDSERPPPSDYLPQPFPALDAVVDRALANKPEDRYPTASAMAADLRAVIASLEPAEASN